MSREYIVGIDIGGTNIRIGAQAENGVIENFQKVSSQRILNGENALENLISFIDQYIKENIPDSPVKAICIGMPSTLNRERDTVIQTPNIEGLDNIPLMDQMTRHFRTRIVLERDVNLLFCNDMKILNIDKNGINIGIYVGTGIGNAIFINGQPYLGADGAAGELGHIPFGSMEVECGCGNRGCAECFAGGKYLTGLRNSDFSATDIKNIFAEHGRSTAIKKYIEQLAKVIAVEINILNPGVIVLGGGVISMEGFPKDMLEEKIHEYTRKPYPEASLDIRYSVDSEENGVKGAVEFAADKLDCNEQY